MKIVKVSSYMQAENLSLQPSAFDGEYHVQGPEGSGFAFARDLARIIFAEWGAK